MVSSPEARMKGEEKKEQTLSLQDETLKSGLPRTSYNLRLVKTQSIHFIYFIIWVLWAVTCKKWHVCKIEAPLSKPSYPLPGWNIYSRDTPQNAAENTELGIRRLALTHLCHGRAVAYPRAYTLSLVCPILTTKSL